MIFSKYKITSLYGYRTLANGDSRFHNGIDIVGIDNHNVISPVEGVVKSSTIVTNKSNTTWEWGNYVRIDTKDGYKHFFCHLAKRTVKVGDKIKKGDIIGVMGDTGYSFGKHTHYGIRNVWDSWVNPLEYYNINLKVNEIYFIDKKYLNVTDAIDIIKKRANIEDKTIKFLRTYKYGDELLKKLASAMQ